MANLLLLVICFLAGVGLRRSGKLDASAPRALNAVVIWVALPALILDLVPEVLRRTPFGWDVLVPASMAWCAFGFSWALVALVARRAGWDRRTTGALVLTVGFGNTAFVGYPLLQALLGDAALPIAVLADQPGTFVAVSTVGLVAASYYGGASVTAGAIARRVVAFPPFVALVVACGWAASGAPGVGTLRPGLAKLDALLVPLALLAVGAQWRLDAAVARRRLPQLAFGLATRLVLIPLVFTAFYVAGLGLATAAVRVTVLQSAMAPMITAAVLAADFGLDEEIATLMIGVGVPASLVTIAGWNAILAALGLPAP